MKTGCFSSIVLFLSLAGLLLAGVAAPAADVETSLARMRELTRERKWSALVQQFENMDFTTWPAKEDEKKAEAFHLRGQAYVFLKNGKQADADLNVGLKLTPGNPLIWLTFADNCVNNLNDDARALGAYRQVSTLAGRSNGWLPLTATLSTARLLIDQVKPEEAIAVLKLHGDMKDMAPIWKIRMLRTYGHAYAAQGKEEESLASFREALKLEAAQ